MATRNLHEAQAHLSELVASLGPGEEVILTDNGVELAKIVKLERTSWPCEPGSARDKILYIAPDFDAPLEDFKEYME